MLSLFSPIYRSLTIVVVLLSVIGCTNDSYTIDCTFSTDFEGYRLKLYNLDAYNFESMAVDSAVIIDGKASFSGLAPKKVLCMLLCENGAYYNFILESGNIRISAEADKHMIGGSPLNDELFAFMQQSDSLSNDFADRYDEVANNHDISTDDRSEQINIMLGDFSRMSVERAMNIIADNRDNPLGQYAFWTEIAYNNHLSKAQYDKYLAEAGEYIASFPQIAMQTKRIYAADRTCVGSKYADVQLNDTTQLSELLSDTRYSLVEVWTSNNPDCYRNTYFMRSIRKRYSPEELNIVSILTEAFSESYMDSDDVDRRSEWLNVFDVNSSMRDAYGIQSLPFLMIVAPDGTIVGRNIKSEALDLWIRTELKKE